MIEPIDLPNGIGQYLRNELELWKNPPNELKQWFIKTYFIHHTDDISSLILTYYHQKKNGIKPDLTTLINQIHEHWKIYIPDYDLKLRRFRLDKIKSNINGKD